MQPASDCVAVTGGGGFIGHALLQDQAHRGHRVRSLDVAHPRPLEASLTHAVERIDGSILRPDDLRRVFAGCSVVHHLASAHLEVRHGEGYFREINVEGTRRVIAAAAAAGVARVVHVSTVGVFGQISNATFDEESPTAPTIAYERTKLEGEQAAREAAESHGIDLVIARPSWVFGAGCRRTRKIFGAIARGRFLMVGSGRIRRDGIYVDDCIRALDLCATHADAPGETFLLVSGEAPTLREWVAAIAAAQGVRPPRIQVPVAPMWVVALGLEAAFKLVGKDSPFSRRSLKFFTNATVFDAAKIRRVLGFEPTRSWREGVRLTAAELGTTAAGEPT